mmetsp:Transcript_30720/g.60352  ORF Transcript_30720/g.60352 Transcript_30720/m.60352 type:complete len:257 (-) Transcript_30720:1614-2384(-)
MSGGRAIGETSAIPTAGAGTRITGNDTFLLRLSALRFLGEAAASSPTPAAVVPCSTSLLLARGRASSSRRNGHGSRRGASTSCCNLAGSNDSTRGRARSCNRARSTIRGPSTELLRAAPFPEVPSSARVRGAANPARRATSSSRRGPALSVSDVPLGAGNARGLAKSSSRAKSSVLLLLDFCSTEAPTATVVRSSAFGGRTNSRAARRKTGLQMRSMAASIWFSRMSFLQWDIYVFNLSALLMKRGILTMSFLIKK